MLYVSLGFLCLYSCVCVLFEASLHNPNLWPKLCWVDVCQVKYRRTFVMMKMKDERKTILIY